MAHFVVYYSTRRYWWRLRDSNHKTIADGSEGYASKYNVQRAIDSVRREVPVAHVIDNT